MYYQGSRIIFLSTILFFGITSLAFGQNLSVYDNLGQSAASQWAPRELIVKFKKGVQEAEIDKINRSKGVSLIAQAKHAKFKRLKAPKGEKIKDVIQAYKKDPRVEYAEPNYVASAHMSPNDPYYPSYQWNIGEMGGWDINMEAAWDIANGGDQNIVVAVLDSGVAYEDYGRRFRKAPDLANTRFVQGYDFVNNDSHANDDNSHGTHVAGTIAQSTNNNLGVAGIAYGVAIMPVKVLDSQGSGYHSWIADGIYYAVDNGAKVINMSLGGPSSETLLDAVAYAYNNGVTIVASAGNERESGSPLSYPAAYDDYCIAVAATRYDGEAAYYSNIGAYVDIAAPGGDVTVDQNGDGYSDGILQNTFNPNTQNTRDFSYWFFQGTSMAAPHVSGVAALLLSHEVAANPDEVRQVLQDTAADLGPDGIDSEYGYGLLDAVAALSYEWQQNTPPIAGDDIAYTNEDVSISIAVLANDSDPDGDSITPADLTQPVNGTVAWSGDMVAYTPDYNYNGPDTFDYSINDGMGGTATATVTVNVAPVNDAPFVEDDFAFTNQNVSVVIDVLANDSDPDGDIISPVNLTNPSNGDVEARYDGTVTYNPDSNFTGTDTFTYQASDGQLPSEVANVTVTVTEVNHPPVAVDDEYVTNEDVPLGISAPGLLANDSDSNGDILTVNAIVTGPENGTLDLQEEGSFTYTPEVDFYGEDSFEYEVSDGKGGTDTALVTITINPVNDPPVAGGDTYTVDQDQTLSVPAPGVLENDDDVENDPLSVNSIETNPIHGSLVLNTDGSFTYTPEDDFYGEVSFEYEVRDGKGGTDTALVTIIVTAATGWNELTFDDFEAGWGNWQDGGADAMLSTSYAIGHYSLNLQDNSSTSESQLADPLHLGDYSQLKIEFSYVVSSFERSEDFWVRYSEDGGSSWQTVKAFVNDVDFVDDGTRYDVVIIIEDGSTKDENGDLINFSDHVLIKFECDASGNKDDVYIDNILISAQ